MKNYLYLTLATMALFSSCASDDTIFENNQKEDNIRFTASIEGCIDTRATLVSNKPNWDAGDIICIDGHDYEASSPGVTTTFTGTGATEATHHAYFPASIYNGGIPTLPAVQSYEEGKFNMPMYAESTTEELEFKNICTVLAVSVSNADIDQVKAIKVASTTKALSGAFTVASDGTMTMTAPDDASKTVTLTCETAVSMTSAEKVFYIAIPAQTYSDLKIYVSSDGVFFTKCMATKKAEGLGALARNKILNIPYETNAVQLWADGPFFATMNVGATITDYSSANSASSDNLVKYSMDYVGKYYCWGGISDDIHVEDSNKSASVLSGSNENFDTATKLWGSSWKMPSSGELTSLIAGLPNSFSTTQEGTNCIWIPYDGETSKFANVCTLKGWEIKGKGAYSNNAVFLPIPGVGCADTNPYKTNGLPINQGVEACYLSSNLYYSLFSNSLEFKNSKLSVTRKGIDWHYSIRAVLK